MTLPKYISYFAAPQRPNPLGEIRENTKKINEVISMLKGKSSNQKLEELDFDPIQELVNQLEDVEKLLATELTYGIKARQAIVVALIANRTKILEALLPYGYNKVTSQDTSVASKETIKIVLAKE